MLIVGLDAAAQFTEFGYAFAEVRGETVVLEAGGVLRKPEALAEIVAPRIVASERCLIAIDAPLGWPEPLARSLAHHEAGGPITAPPNTLFRRATDDHIHQRLGRRPLDIGADRIARAAWRALEVIATLRRLTRLPLPLAWSRKDVRRASLIEVYPAATLAAHGAPVSGYKKPGQRRQRVAIAGALSSRLRGLEVHLDGPDHVFDAGLCVLAALDFLEGRAVPPEDKVRAGREGWIWAAQRSSGSPH